MKKFLYAFGLFLWVAFAFNASLLGSSSQTLAAARNPLGDTTKVMSPGWPQVCDKDNCVTVEVVSKPEDMERGLMYRTGLAKTKGMFFIFAFDDKHSFWMKNMRFSLDMVWINKDRQIIYVAPNVPACTSDPCAVYTPDKDARYVLEIESGYASAHHWQLGDILDLKDIPNIEK